MAPKEIEIARPGTFQDRNGQVMTLGPDDLARLAAIYDPALKAAPITAGHKPESGEPARGWVKSLTYEPAAKRLKAIIDDVPSDFADFVREGAYRYVSPAFYLRNQPSNPRPGELYLHHVALLGAAAPAISGLAQVAFSEGGEGLAIWSDATTDRLSRMLAGALEDLRIAITAALGSTHADRILPRDTFRQLGVSPAEVIADTAHRLMAVSDVTAARLDLSEREPDQSARARARAFADELVGKAQLPSGLAPKVADILATVDGFGMEVQFSEANGDKPRPLYDAIKDVLSLQPPMVAFGEFAPRGRSVHGEDRDGLYGRAERLAQAKGISFERAVIELSKKENG